MNRDSSLLSRLNASMRRSLRFRIAILMALFPGLFLWTPVYSNPTGGVVVHGDISMNGGAGNLTITQNSQNAIINWEDFSIDAGELTQFLQPGSSAAVLNRVTGGNPSAIHGALQANGSVFVINPNGILVGATGTIDVYGLVLSTLDVSNGEFLAGGDMVFKGDSQAGVTNMGRINGIGGDVFLIGKTVANTGAISAAGTVGLGAGEEVLLTAPGEALGERMFVRSTGSGASGTGVLNDGTIEGAAVELKAHGNLYALAINNKGSVRAVGVENEGGKVFLRGVGGTVGNSGSIEATSTGVADSASVLIEAAYARAGGFMTAANGDGSGGAVLVSASESALLDGSIDVSGGISGGGSVTVEADSIDLGATAAIRADGADGGGLVQIGGGFQGREDSIQNAGSLRVAAGAEISANATETGNGGTVILWSDESTVFEGSISARALAGSGDGGFVEVSGKNQLTFDGAVSTLSAGGRNGSLFLDPTDLTISNGSGTNIINVGNLVTALASNNVVIATDGAGTQDGDIRINDNVDYTSVNSLTLLANGDIEAIRRVQNQGSGDINLVAGWDGTTGFSSAAPGTTETGTVDMNDFFNSPASYGNAKLGGGNGSVILNASSQRVSIGSRFGSTNVAAYGVNMLADGWGSTAQFGIFDVDSNAAGIAADGDIRIDVHDAIIGTSPAQTGALGGVQIGHGGVAADNGPGAGALTGNIFVNAGVEGRGSGDISFVINTTGDVERFNMQIGHGGRRNHGSHSGNITVDTTQGTSGNITFEGGQAARNYVMIGHGGENIGETSDVTSNNLKPQDLSGEITVRTGGDLTFRGGKVRGAAPADAWRNTADAYAQLGHGGRNADGSHSGAITVESGGDILFESGDQNRNFAQLGHGGHGSDGDHSGEISVTADGTISFDARGFGDEPIVNTRQESYVHLGHGGYAARGNHSDAISVTSGGDISFFGGNNTPGGISGYRSYAQLGHGGLDSDSPNDDVNRVGNAGNITIQSGGGLLFQGGNADEAYVHLGHGGSYNRGPNLGNIVIDADGPVTFAAGERLGYAQLGHGGYEADGLQSGAIELRTTGDITFTGGMGTQARDFRASAQLGHGGYSTVGAHTGDITVATDGFIRFAAGQLSDNYAHLGHGGRAARSGSNTTGFTGDIDVSAGTGISFVAGSMIARTTANGFVGQDILDANTGDPFTQAEADTVNSDEGVYADGRLYAMLGHGGYDADASANNTRQDGIGHEGDIRVVSTTGDITFNGSGVPNQGANASAGDGEGRISFALLGHGGAATVGDHAGAIEVEATAGSVAFNGGNQTGDGGINRDTGVLTADQTDTYNYAQLGHGGVGNQWGNTPSNVTGRLSANSVGGTLGLADGISVTAGNGVQFNAGLGRRSYAQLGLGGYEARGVQDGALDHRGDITVSAGSGGVIFAGGINTTEGSQLGTNNNNHGRESYAQLGHGGFEGDGTYSGNISVTTTAGGDVSFFGGTRSDNYVQMGHGGRSAQSGGVGIAGGNKGDITVNASGSVVFQAGTLYETTDATDDARIYAQLGHGGFDGDAFGGGTLIAGSGHEGDITVNAGGDLRLLGGDTANGSNGTGLGRFHYAQIGHGGYTAGGDHKGAINVSADGAVDLLGGNSVDNSRDTYNFVQIGHGGRGDANSGALSSVSLSGNTDGVNVSAGNGLTVKAGNSRSFAQIGLGGYSYLGDHVGDVSATTTGGDILLQAGFEEVAHAMIGNGGYNLAGNMEGNIKVVSAGALSAIGGSGISDTWGQTNVGHESFVQIGHGGRLEAGNGTGNIVVRAQNQVEVLAGQNGSYRSYAQIGHGGERRSGTFSGLVSVIAGSGTSKVIATQGLLSTFGGESYAQVGHGGTVSSGNRSGNVEFITVNGGSLDMASGNNGAGGNAYAMIGHGGTGMAAADEVSGNITVLIDGELSVVRNEAQTQIAHRGGLLTRQPGDLDSDLTVIAGSMDNNLAGTDDLIRITDDVAQGQIFNVWIRPYLDNSIGNVVFGTSGSGSVDWSDVDYDYNSTKNFTLTSGADLFFMKRIRNREQIDGGDFNALGNWGGTVGAVQFDLLNDEAVTAGFSMAAVLADAASLAPTWAGTNNGNTIVGQNFAGLGNNGSVQVGSSTGTTSVLGHDVRVIAGGDEGGNGRYAQIGVNDGTSGFRHTGSVNVYATNNVEVRAGTAGGPGLEDGNRGAYGMIGHGGVWSSARLPELSGDITVDAGGGILAVSGTNEYNYTQIGHGGAAGYDAANPTGKLFGDISVAARSGSIQFTGGTGLRSHSQIGHGGRDTDPHDLDSGNPDESSNIFVTAGGDISFHGGTGSVSPVSETGRESYAMLGHGGYSSEVRTDNEGWYGDISVTSGGTIDFRAGDSRDNFVQLGHGGRSRAGVNGSHSGDILVSAGNGVNFIGGVANAPANGDPAGQDSVLFAQLGHGGWDSDVNFSNNPVAGLGHTGDIRVTTLNGDINFLGGATDRTGDLAQFNGVGTTARYSYSQLGHGGMETKGEHSGAIEVEATNGDVNVLAGTQDDPDNGDEVHYAQVGHGGASFNWGGGAENIKLSANSVSATSGVVDGISVIAGGDVNVTASDAGRSFAMIGLGGWGNDGDHEGDISVTSGGDVVLRGGNSFENFAQIGNGGRGAAGAQSGNIEVTGAGRLDVLAGGGNDSYAMIGHGGTHGAQMDGNRSGDIFVSFAEGIAIHAGISGGARALSQIGHGGYNANGDHSGFVTVVNSTSGDIVLRGGDGANDKSAQIGHRGDNSLSSDLSGSISVVNLGGGISLQGGNGNWRGAIIGHGDAQNGITGGQRTGGLNVYASGAVSAVDGAGNSGAYISHQTNSGIGSVSYAGAGVTAAGDSGYSVVGGGGITFGNQQLTGPGNALSFGETIGAALAEGNVTIASGGGADLDLNAIDTASGGAVSAALTAYDSDNDVTFAAGRDLFVGFNLQNQGTGNISLLAGWSGAGSGVVAPPQMDALALAPFYATGSGHALGAISIPDFEQAIPLPASCLEFAVGNDGDIVLGSAAQTTAFRVGSRAGTTSLFGHSVTLNAGSGAGAATQVGFFTNGSGDATGEITVAVHEGGLRLNSGSGAGAYTLIGHGGTGANDDIIDADITISFCETAPLDLNAASDGAFARIGHGVEDGVSALGGDIAIDGFSAATLDGGAGVRAYAQIGHGGALSSGGVTDSTIGLTGASLNGVGGAGNGSYVMIGHGGWNETRDVAGTALRTGFAEATRAGDIAMTLSGNFDLTGGGGEAAFVQVGHGGRRNNAVDGEGHSGSVEITARSFDIFGGAGKESYGMAGHGGYQTTGNHSGDITITTTGPNNDQGRLRLRPDVGGDDDADRAFTQIGHGGYDADFNTADLGTVPDITALPYYVDNRAANLSGNITVNVAENVVVIAVASNQASEAYSQIGHGGFDTTGSFGAAGDRIEITAGGTVIVRGSEVAPIADLAGRGNYGQIGHGGVVNNAGATAFNDSIADPNLNLAAAGSHTADIIVNALAVQVIGGIDNEGYAQIGHGGVNSGAGGGHTGDITVTATSAVNSDVVLRGGPGGGFASHAMIGHGGRNADGSHNGSITISADRNIFLDNSGAGDAFTMIGHGGINGNGNLGLATDSISATAGNNVILEPGLSGSFSMIGLGGRNHSGDLTLGDLTVTATGGYVELNSGVANGNSGFSMLGLGGQNASGNKVSNQIAVTAGGANAEGYGVALRPASIGSGRFAQIGNGGLMSNGLSFASDITVNALAGGVLVEASETSNQSYAMIGNGGRFDRAGAGFQVGTMTGNIAVTATGADSDIIVRGGGGTGFAQIGLGGFQAGFAGADNPLFDGTITLSAGRDLEISGGAVVNPVNSSGYAQVGHGGLQSDGARTGQISVDVGRSILMAGGGQQGDGTANFTARVDQYAQLGHGGRNSLGSRDGDILINRNGGAGTGEISLTGGDSDRSYVQIGHGGHGAIGDIGQTSGAILMTTAGNVSVNGGRDQEAYAQIGHGGDSADAAGVGFNGDVEVISTGGDILLSANPLAVNLANRASARIGHGGLNNNDATGDFTGAITVSADIGSVVLTAGDLASNNDVQIGHGGISASALAGHSGAIAVTAGDAINLFGGAAGAGVPRSARIGHGGDGTNGILSGGIILDAGGDIFLTGGSAGSSGAAVGHGGRNSDGAKDGVITVTSGGAVYLEAGAANSSFAQIGHGGEDASGTIGAVDPSAITVEATTGVTLAGNTGSAGTSHTQIGHGGLRGGEVGNTITGTIAVSTTGGDLLVSGSQIGTGESYTQIGHGGQRSIFDVNDQSITIEASGGGIALSGSGSQNHVMIGHGGESSTGDLSGAIDVLANDAILLTGGQNLDAMTQIGHGGLDHLNGAAGTLGGDIHVRSISDSVTLASAGAENQKGTAVQIGHGGYQQPGVGPFVSTTITGDICVIAGTTATLTAAGGGGEGSYAMIGHGGVRLEGDRTGDITVTTGTAGTGGVFLTGGNGTNEFAQIGHGGIDSNGRMSGDVYVIVDDGGDIDLLGGTGSSTNYAMIGHGDGEGNTSSGLREGGIHIFASNQLTATNGAGQENVNVWHQTNGGLVAADYEGGDGFQIFQDLNGLAASAVDPAELVVMAEGNFGAGSVNVITSADTDIVFNGGGTGDILVNSTDDFFFVTGGSVTFENSYQNAGTGNVTIVAGWNGQGVRPPATVEYVEISPGVFNYCEPVIRESGVVIDFNDCGTFGTDPTGNGNGTITLGSPTQDAPVYVGSRLGRTVAAGYGLTLNAGDTAGAATQLGFHNGSVVGSTGEMTGAIDVFVKGGGLVLNGGSGANAYAQIGHGGTGATVGTVNAPITISFCEPGDILSNDPLVAGVGAGSHAYTMIGHGFTDASATINSDILIDGFRNLTLNGGSGDTAFSMIGLGGDNSDGVKTGTITLTGAALPADQGNLAMQAGSGNRAFTMIGIGGRDVNDNKFGSIEISNIVDLDLDGGGLDAFAQIGNGGGDASNGPLQGSIDIDISGNLTMDAGNRNEAYAQIGHGGHSQINGVMNPTDDNEIRITTGGYLTMTGTSEGTPATNPAAQAYVQIGHGGRGSRGGSGGAFAFERYGDIVLDIQGADGAGAAVSMRGGNSNESYVQIGHGGRDARGYYEGDIDFNAAGDIVLEGGGRSRTYAMIGHGGDDADAVAAATPATLDGNRGGISITTTNGGDLILRGSQAPTGSGADHVDSNAQVGHGGHSTTGNHAGEITLMIDGDVSLLGGVDTSTTSGADRNYAQIGHGGEAAGGNHTGTISVTAGGRIEATAGSEGGANYVQIGHGGIGANGVDDGSGNLIGPDAAIFLVADGDIAFQRNLGNRGDSYAMVGHGGNAAGGTKSGDISVISNNGSILFGTDTTRTGRSAVQLGHGGRSSSGDTSGNIIAQALNGDVRFHGTFANDDNNHREGFAQLGHGGRDAIGNHGTATDLIDVDSGGVIEFLAGGSTTAGAAGQGLEAYAQLGHGGYGSDGDHAGNIEVDAIGDILFDTRGISGDRAYVQLGHGGFSSNGSFSGNIAVNQNVAGGAISFLAGRSASYAQLGHGGRNDAGSTRNNSGPDGIPNTVDDVRVENSARFAPGTITGDIAVRAANDITFTGGFEAGGTGYAQLGHGGYQQVALADEGHTGEIEVISSGGGILFTGGTRNIQYAMIGHGGFEAFGNHGGNITVEALTGISFVAGGSTLGGGSPIGSFAQIGHGGFNSDFESGRAIGEFGVVNGAAGFNDDIPLTDPGLNFGTITVTTTGVGADISLQGAVADANFGRGGYAQIGHGGLGTSGDREGAITISSGGGVLLTRGTTDDAYAQIGHGGRSAGGSISNADISVTSANGGKVALQGDGLPATSGSASRAYVQIGHGGHNGDVEADAAVIVTGDGGIDILGGGYQESFAMIGHGGDSADAQGSGFNGNITLQANTGDIMIISNQPEGAVGNRTFAKVGHGGYISATGDYSGNISVAALAGGVVGTAGRDGNNNYVQIGHGGVANTASIGHSGTIDVLAANDITFTGGLDNGGPAGNDRQFAMIGHGGANSNGNHSGAVTVEAGRDGTGSITFTAGDIRGTAEGPFVQIGHGGHNHNGDLGGAVTVTAADDIAMLGGTSTDGAYAQIGHGGRNAKGDRTGAIEVEATNGSLALVAGNNDNNYSQIGHGGHDADFTGALGGTTAAETIQVRAGTSIEVTAAQLDNANDAAQSYAQIGHGGQYADGNHLATVTVNAGTTLSVLAGQSNQAYAQIGHGGLFNGAGGKGNQAGNIDVDAGGDISVTGGIRDRSYAQIGHGGFDHDGTKDGIITVDTSGGSVTVTGGSTFNDAYAQIGHGGGNSEGIIGATSGDVTVNASGSISVVGNQSGLGTNYSQIGHGGRSSGAAGETAAGAITVNSSGGDVTLTGSNGGSAESHTQIGHGGMLSSYDVVNSLIDIDAGGAITLTGSGAQNSTMIGHGGERAAGTSYGGGIDVLAGSEITLTGGSNVDAAAQIGHGGSDTNATLNGAITVESIGGRVATLAGAAAAGTYTQIGHGGSRSQGTFDGAITVEAGTEIDFSGGAGGFAYSQIGHGGHSSTSTRSGSITAIANAGSISFNGGSNNQAYAQLGHGGDSARGTGDGVITANAIGGDITFSAGVADRSSAQLGHGGTFNDGGSFAQSGDIDVDATGDVRLASGGGNLNWKNAQIGHGGFRADGTKTGAINVDAGGVVDLDASGSTGIQSYVQLGHGGYEADGDISNADITVNAVGATGAISFAAGNGADGYAQLGHGGAGATGAFDSVIAVRSTGDISFAGGDGSNAYAQIGHGGADTTAGDNDGTRDGDIAVSTISGDITFSGGSTPGAYSQIGHGGFQDDAAQSGEINVVSGGNLTFTGGSVAEASAMIGHGGTASGFALTNPTALATGVRQGDIRIVVDGDTTLADGGGLGFLGHLGATGVSAASNFGLITGTLDTSAAAAGLSGIIENMAPAGEVEIGVRNGDLTVDGPGGFYLSPNTVDLAASGSVHVLSSLQNAGSGDLNVVAGWDAVTGLSLATDFNAVPIIPVLSLDIAAILTDPVQYGVGGLVNIGDGGQTLPAAIGSASGTTTVAGAGVNLLGSDTTDGGLVQIGFYEELYRNNSSGANGVPSSGDIVVIGKTGGVNAFAGDANGASAQIGHGGASASSALFSGDITIESGSNVTVDGGDGLQSFAQIGHGGAFSNGTVVTGDVTVEAENDVNIAAGQQERSYAQIGSGGAAAGGSMSGDIAVAAGNDINIDGSSTFAGAHAKIGLGDDPDSGLTGTGSRDGDISVSAGADIGLSNGMIGHVNAAKAGTNPASGETAIAVSRLNPTNPAGGSLTADALSELAGPDGLRVYLPERSSNDIAAGAFLNGVSFTGARVDPSAVQGAEEFTVLLADDLGGSVALNQHTNQIGSGPAPANAGNFAFYYNRIVLLDLPDPVLPPGGGGEPGDGGDGTDGTGGINSGNPDAIFPGTGISLRRAQSEIPDDRTTDDWQREQEGIFTGFNSFNVFYEGYDHYSRGGQSIFNWLSTNQLDTSRGGDDSEDVLRRQQQILEEEAGNREGDE